MRSVCVFCGSSSGALPEYREAARRLGRELAGRGVTLVYGGASVGIMGAVADATLEAGGRVVGVIPRALMEREVGHRGLSELLVVESMHQRKAEMAERAEGFIALPGGLGTLEELFEVWTWAQLGIHRKPFGLLDVAGFYAPPIAFLDHAVEQGFVRQAYRSLARLDDDPARLLDLMCEVEPVSGPRWISPAET